MKWSNVKLIYARELRDQLRDRRTLFTVLVLPLLLYPLMGMALLQVSQFLREHPTRIWIVGAENLPLQPPLLVENAINSEFVVGSRERLIEVEVSENPWKHERILSLVEEFKFRNQDSDGSRFVDQLVQKELKARNLDLAVAILEPVPKNGDTVQPADVSRELVLPRIAIFRNSASDKSNIASERFNLILSRWQRQVAVGYLTERRIDPKAIETIAIFNADVADESWKRAATWSKILPFIVMIWSLTGAFYPAVDLCAGEKERGTFETLLSSPALRNEIAMGKLLTVMTFSIVTSLLNLISMGVTASYVVARLTAGSGHAAGPTGLSFGAPPLSSVGWLILALIPISALFSAVALAAASFARSSKEGQYYLVPLMLISMPLMMLPMLPGAKLDLGTSLIPVTGLMMMLRGLIEGEFAETMPFVGPVCAVTLICCWLSVRWVVAQFNSESVLFRPSERFGVTTWIRQIVRQRDDLPLAGQALVCAVVILVVKFFMGMGVAAPESWGQFARQTLIVLVAAVGVPAALMAMFLTSRPSLTLRLRRCSVAAACAAALAAISLHPAFMWLTSIVVSIYPPSGDLEVIQQSVNSLLADASGFWAILLVMAIAPAIVEEFAFRGFILSGLQSLGSNAKAVVISSVLFGAAHTILQQSIVAFFVGLVLGYIAIRAGSLLPCIIFHAVHNGVSVAFSMLDTQTIGHYPLFSWLFWSPDGIHYRYGLLPSIGLTTAGILLLLWFWRLSRIDYVEPQIGSRNLIQHLYGSMLQKIGMRESR
jgi:sodium transport system permease protein